MSSKRPYRIKLSLPQEAAVSIILGPQPDLYRKSVLAETGKLPTEFPEVRDQILYVPPDPETCRRILARLEAPIEDIQLGHAARVVAGKLRAKMERS